MSDPAAPAANSAEITWSKYKGQDATVTTSWRSAIAQKASAQLQQAICQTLSGEF